MNRLGVQVFMRLFIPLNSAGVRCHRWGAGLCHALRDYVWLRCCCAHWLSRLALSPYIEDSRRIRMISDSVRSSCAASSCRSRLSESGSRTVISAIFFSMDMGSEIKGARGLSLAKACGPDFENRRRGGREAGRHLCGLLVAFVLAAVGGAKVGPINVGAQVFAADSAGCGALDGRAVFCRDASVPAYPLAHHAGRHVANPCDCYLPAKDFCRFFHWVFHNGFTLARLNLIVNSPAKWNLL